MANFFKMPAASPTMEEGRILAWRKAEGDALAPQDVVAEVETDKASMEIEVFDPGFLLKILVPADEVARVDQPIAIIGASPDEDFSALLKQLSPSSPSPSPTPAPAPAPTSAPAPAPAAAAAAPAAAVEAKAVAAAPGAGGVAPFRWHGEVLDSAVMELPEAFSVASARPRSAPAARRLASVLGVPLEGVEGSGPHGRVMTDDIRRVAEGRTTSPPAAVAAAAAVAVADDEVVAHTNMRKTIARRMKAVYLDAPVFFLTAVLDCGALVAFREQLKAGGAKASYNDILMKAVARALREVPAVNASWGDDAITLHRGIHVGMAVALEGGLIVPVVRNVDQKGLSQIAEETRELAGRARDLKLKPEEYQGSTFTISNLGMMDIEHFTAIINQPNSAILAVGSLQQEPVVVNGALAVGWRMRVTLTCDHRVIDGALGATFLQVVRRYIENPALLAT